MKTIFMYVVIFLIKTNLQMYAQNKNEINFNGKEYFKKEGKIFVVSGETKYEVDTLSITVRFNPLAQKRSIDSLNNLLSVDVLRINALGFYDLLNKNNIDIFELATAYKLSGMTESIDINSFGTFNASPNDSLYSDQWYWYNSSDHDVDASDAWEIETGKSSVTVGVVDSGLEWEHPDIGFGTDGYQNIKLNTNDAWTFQNDPTSGDGIDNDSNGFIDDYK